MATAKQVFYSPPQTLLSKRKNSTGGSGPGGGGPALTVTIPFTFSSRLSRRQDRSQSAASIRRSRTTLPKLQPQQHRRPNHHHHHHQYQQQHRQQHPQSARPSITTTSRSTTATSDSVAKRTAESVCETQSKASSANAADDPGRSAVGTEPSEAEVPEDVVDLSPEEKQEMKRTNAKCVKWLQGLPNKFSGMHIVQQITYADHR